MKSRDPQPVPLQASRSTGGQPRPTPRPLVILEAPAPRRPAPGDPARPAESISVFDIFKIGVGPSSSHTMGPWRATQKFIALLHQQGMFDRVVRVRAELYGSLAKTGKGHGTDIAIILALGGDDPETCDTASIDDRVEAIGHASAVLFDARRRLPFDPAADIVFHSQETLPFHPNGMTLIAMLEDGSEQSQTYYSIGGGFVVQENESAQGRRALELPYPIETGDQLIGHCEAQRASIPEIVRRNERAWRDDQAIDAAMNRIISTMEQCILKGCHTPGILPGGLGVSRRAAEMNTKLMHRATGGASCEAAGVPMEQWKDSVRRSGRTFQQILKWVSCFALAVNEENASFGRVVTAPTNGAAGVIPAVLMYYQLFCDSSPAGMIDFMLTAGELGSLFKKGATISAAMGGCQAEIGVSSAMAAGGLTQVLGGTPGQVLMAAEIAMEHHLGMTCDPIGGLVQIPCIERNTMGAIKAITAAHIAIESDPTRARVSLDGVIKTMWETAKDMGGKYKETSEGGLAVNISVGIIEC